jgi:hypothetical protein
MDLRGGRGEGKNRRKDAKGCKRTLARRLQPFLWLILMDRVLA